jgi:hypothetical protein
MAPLHHVENPIAPGRGPVALGGSGTGFRNPIVPELLGFERDVRLRHLQCRCVGDVGIARLPVFGQPSAATHLWTRGLRERIPFGTFDSGHDRMMRDVICEHRFD